MATATKPRKKAATKTTKKAKEEAATPTAASPRPDGDLVCTITLEGMPPGLMFQSKGLMIHEQKHGSKKKGKKYLPPEEEAPYRAHWITNGKSKELAIPTRMLYLCFCQAGRAFQQAQNKKLSMEYLVGSTVAFEMDFVGLGTDKHETYEDYVRIPPRTGAMVLIGRPLIRQWRVTFDVIVDDYAWEAEHLFPEILTHAGRAVGIGAWRPGLKGSYGRFKLKGFSVRRRD